MVQESQNPVSDQGARWLVAAGHQAGDDGKELLVALPLNYWSLPRPTLLTAAENGAGGKSDTPPEEWFDGKPPEYLDLHLIPADRDLWKLENFEAFIAARKELILKRFEGLLQRSVAS